MKVVILAGGLGTRLAEETTVRPKPMVAIGGRPILWHIMKMYSHHGFNDFVVCLGYKGYVIKEYFANYMLHASDITVDLGSGDMQLHDSKSEPWRVTLVDTGQNTMTGGRLKRVREHLGGERFMMTYGDGVCDVDISAVLAHHESKGRLATVTAVPPASRFGMLELDDRGNVREFREKPPEEGGLINGGFFVLEPEVIDYIEGDNTPFERAPLEKLAADDQLAAFAHRGFWQCMDTLRDLETLERLWTSGTPPWRSWS